MAAPVLAPMPDQLDVGPTYTLRVVALDPATGNTVAGANIGTTVITATSLTQADTSGLEQGDWFLVPGPGA
jgi:NADPH:quinone reductase-like Zn-dependent oxidoreductase